MNCQEQIPGAVLYQVVPEVCPVQVPTAAQVVCLEVQEVFLAADPMEAAQEGEAQEVFRHPKHPYTRRLIAAIPTRNRKEGGA